MTEKTPEILSAETLNKDIQKRYPFRLNPEYNEPNYIKDLAKDEPRPGMDEVEASFYDASADKHEILNKKCGEYSDHNLRFWGFMFGAVFASLLMYATIQTGSGDREYKFLNKPRFSPEPEIVIVGFIGFFFLTAFMAYHNWKERNGPTFSHGTLFFMIITWVFALWWAVLFYAEHSEKDSQFMLFISMTALFLWIILIMWKGNYDLHRIWYLFIAIIWLLYLFWFNIETVKINNTSLVPLEDCKGKNCFGDKTTRINRFERFRRNNIF